MENPEWGGISSAVESFIEDLQKIFKTVLRPPMLLALGGLGLVLWLASGLYVVGPGEQGVIRQFGKIHSQTGPGLGFHLPLPIQSRDVVDVARVRRAEIGFRSEGGRQTMVIDEESLMLTGDENIVASQLFVQYVIKDPSAFLFRARDPEQMLTTAAEVALRNVVGRNTIDFTMTDGRFQVQEQTKEQLQRLLDDYRTGLLATEVRLLVVDPPLDVKDAFHDVVRAWEDRERLIQEARGFAEDILPRSRGEAAEAVRKAEGYKEQRIIRSQGEAERFLDVRESYEKSPTVTRERLYLEMMERILPHTEKVILPSQSTGSVLPWLPLKKAQAPHEMPAITSQKLKEVKP
ncbi:MAG: FtsH protease activity modulator HflK [Candidatus Omnitrophota bacterium]|nr:FtsH protease activity modulator HflK [Candidatus Omnitrophota bacterium]